MLRKSVECVRGVGFRLCCVCVLMESFLIDCLKWPVCYCPILFHPDTGIVILGDARESGGYAATNE